MHKTIPAVVPKEVGNLDGKLLQNHKDKNGILQTPQSMHVTILCTLSTDLNLTCCSTRQDAVCIEHT